MVNKIDCNMGPKVLKLTKTMGALRINPALSGKKLKPLIGIEAETLEILGILNKEEICPVKLFKYLNSGKLTPEVPGIDNNATAKVISSVILSRLTGDVFEIDKDDKLTISGTGNRKGYAKAKALSINMSHLVDASNLATKYHGLTNEEVLEDCLKSIYADTEEKLLSASRNEQELLSFMQGFCLDKGIVKSILGMIKDQDTTLFSAICRQLDAKADSFPIHFPKAASLMSVFKDFKFTILKMCFPGRKSLAEILEEQKSPVILVKEEVFPSEALTIGDHRDKVAGVIIGKGAKTEHGVLLLDNKGIPLVYKTDSFELIEKGSQLILDSNAGCVHINPDEEDEVAISKQQKKYEDFLEAAKRFDRIKRAEISQSAAETQNKIAIDLLINCDSQDILNDAIEHGAFKGIGLLRSETLYMQREREPEASELAKFFSNMAKLLSSHRNNFDGLRGLPAGEQTKVELVIRTLDLGGDKTLPYVRNQSEKSGLALCLENPVLRGILDKQLEGILRASAWHPKISVLFPMVESAALFLKGKELLENVKQRLLLQDVAFNNDIRVGAMIEDNSGVINCADIAAKSDFLSIGTNDLSQSLTGISRANGADAFDPGVLKAIGQVIAVGKEAGIPVSVCGDIAGSPLAMPVLLGLGLERFSMPHGNLDISKYILNSIYLNDCKELADNVIKYVGSAGQARETTLNFIRENITNGKWAALKKPPAFFEYYMDLIELESKLPN